MRSRWLGLFLVLGVHGFVDADASLCPGTRVSVLADVGDEVDEVCKTIDTTFLFLTSQGLDTRAPLEIRMVDTLPPQCDRRSFACYDCRTRCIHMLKALQCLKLDFTAEVPMTTALCRSVLSHEIAHAVADANFLVDKPSRLAHEYIAYITQLSTMPAGMRQQVLERFPGNGFSNADEMSVDYYLLDPTRFGVQAYRHFMKPGNGKAFVGKLLAGKVLRR